MDAAFALEVLDKAPYVTVSMIKSDGSPYGLPLSLVRTDEKTFYFHCALEGDKFRLYSSRQLLNVRLRLALKMEVLRYNTNLQPP